MQKNHELCKMVWFIDSDWPQRAYAEQLEQSLLIKVSLVKILLIISNKVKALINYGSEHSIHLRGYTCYLSRHNWKRGQEMKLILQMDQRFWPHSFNSECTGLACILQAFAFVDSDLQLLCSLLAGSPLQPLSASGCQRMLCIWVPDQLPYTHSWFHGFLAAFHRWIHRCSPYRAFGTAIELGELFLKLQLLEVGQWSAPGEPLQTIHIKFNIDL